MKRLKIVVIAMAAVIMPQIAAGQNQITRPGKKKTTEQTSKQTNISKKKQVNQGITSTSTSSEQTKAKPNVSNEQPSKMESTPPKQVAEEYRGLVIKDFKSLPDDNTASDDATRFIDWNNSTAALIKIRTRLNIDQLSFEVKPGIVAKKIENGEIWLYVPDGIASMTVKHREYNPIKYFLNQISKEEKHTRCS